MSFTEQTNRPGWKIMRRRICKIGTDSPPQAAESAAAYLADDPGVLQAWIAECERRYQDFLEGKTKAIPAGKALAQIRRQLKNK